MGRFPDIVWYVLVITYRIGWLLCNGKSFPGRNQNDIEEKLDEAIVVVKYELWLMITSTHFNFMFDFVGSVS